jgi:prepilin peptidase CpaA
LLLPLYLLRGLGAGDVKFFAAVGAALTVRHVMTVLVLSALIVAVMAAVHVVRHRRLRQAVRNVRALLHGLIRGKGVPLGEVSLEKRPDAMLLPFSAGVAAALWLFVLFGQRPT